MKLGFVGLGKMGTPMAKRLIDAGHDVFVTDVNTEAISHLVNAGAHAAFTAKEVGDRAEIVFASLPTPEVARSVAFGKEGIAQGAAVRYYVDLSTTGPATMIEVARGLEIAGKVAIDCPVSGGVRGAARGTLSLMVACSDDAFSETEPALGLLGNPVHIGTAPGSAQVLKLANNMLAISALAITGEACAFRVKAGLDPLKMCEVFSKSSGVNTATLDKFPKSVLPGTFDFGFASGLAMKDLRLCIEEAEKLGVHMPLAQMVRGALDRAIDMFGPDSDFTSIVRPLESDAGIEIRSVRS